MAVVNPDMENDSSDLPRTRSFYRPTEGDFNRILDKLKAQGERRTLRISPTILDEGNETKQEKHERLRQEALQRDQYILSMRPNRHVVFAAKFAKIKNQGLSKRFEKQVHIWSQEMERNFRLVGANEKALEKELQQRGTRKEERHTLPHLQAAKKSENSGGNVKLHSVKLPRLPRLGRNGERTQRAKRASKTEQGGLKGDVNENPDGIEFSNASVKLPPIETEKERDSHID